MEDRYIDFCECVNGRKIFEKRMPIPQIGSEIHIYELETTYKVLNVVYVAFSNPNLSVYVIVKKVTSNDVCYYNKIMKGY